MRRIGAFTLVELLTVMAIIAILSAVLLPAAMGSQALAFQWTATQAIGQLGTAAAMYASENDETMPLATYQTADGLQAWFGRRSPDGKYRTEFGLLLGYTGRKILRDSTYTSRPFFGDGGGFGYNWAYIGSDFAVKNNYDGFPNCANAARLSEIADPSHTVLFATSSKYYAPWEPGGDGLTYDMGVIDAPRFWNGNPNVDFRHNGVRIIDLEHHQVQSKGVAPVAYADSRVSVKHQTEMTDSNFQRDARP